jgi:hypothetical protein
VDFVHARVANLILFDDSPPNHHAKALSVRCVASTARLPFPHKRIVSMAF